jgi:hypothetical protein
LINNLKSITVDREYGNWSHLLTLIECPENTFSALNISLDKANKWDTQKITGRQIYLKI